MSSGLYSHTTRGIGTVLTAAIYNADHNNHITNANPSQHGGYSDSVPEMQTMVNPGGVGTEVLASNLAGEIARLRYVINRIAGTTHWYEAPVTSLATIGGGIPLTLAFAAVPLTLRRTENNTTPLSIISFGSGSGVGNKMNIQAVGTGANAIGELRWLLGATELFRMTAALFTYFFAQEFRSYLDIKEIAAPATPAADTLRLYAKDVSGSTKLFQKDPAGVERAVGAQGSYGYNESNTYQAISTSIPLDDTLPTSSEGTSILSTAVTLQNASSPVKVRAVVPLFSAANTNSVVALFRGSVCIGASWQSHGASTGFGRETVVIDVEDNPGSVGPHTYSVRVGGSSTVYINGNASSRLLGGMSKVTLTVEERLT